MDLSLDIGEGTLFPLTCHKVVAPAGRTETIAWWSPGGFHQELVAPEFYMWFHRSQGCDPLPSTPKLAETDFPLQSWGAIIGGSLRSLGSAALSWAGGGWGRRLGHQPGDSLPSLQLMFRGRHGGRPCPG